MHPSFVCVFFYRLSNHFYRRGHKYLARFLWQINFALTGSDISEPADFAEGFVVLNPAGCSLMGESGRNLTVMACAGIGGELSRRGVPVIGDDVTLGPHAGFLGPIRIGHGVRMPSNTGAIRDIPDYAVIEGPRLKFRTRKEEG